MDETEYFWDTTKLYVTDGNGHERSQEEPPLSAAFERAYEEGRAGFNDDGEMVFVDDDRDELEWRELRAPLLVDIYEGEVEKPRANRMKPYRSGSMTERKVYWKPTAPIKEKLTKKLGREPEIVELVEAVSKANTYVISAEDGRRNEVAIAQVIYNRGLTPFIGDEVWKERLKNPEPKKGETEEEWQLRLDEWEKLKELEDSFEQTDLYVAGVPVECKRLGKLENFSKVINGELYVFVCSESSYSKKPKGERYYLISFWSAKSNKRLREESGIDKISSMSPAVVPVERVDLREMEFLNQRGRDEQGIFVKATDLISFNQFIKGLKRHQKEISKTSRKLEDIEVVQLLYPDLDQQGQQQKLEQEHARRMRHQQKLNDDFDF